MRFRAERWLALSIGLLLAGCGGGIHGLVQDSPVKLGRPYTVRGQTYVPTDDRAYDQIGEASWYGTAEQGHHTASGEIFYRQRPSAANKTLPLPSYVEVTRLDTGQRILVRVNDRGPFARDRILDLSQEAAKELGMDRAGRAMVRVRRVTPSNHERDRLRRGYPVVLPSVTPTATPPRTGRVAPYLESTVQQPVAVTPPRRWAAPVPVPPAPLPAPAPAIASPSPSILVAAPTDPDAADALASSLASEGARVVAAGGGYRVVTGPYADDSGLSAALARLRARGYQGATVIDATPPQEPNGTSLP
ncbi:septal ring lytic transglycosylase RlpA family protein [Sphingomonas abietis]|uniref:Endolytic peptidoglycan transglycosylase RlpA n=1 Tax=Sphingomonas abietis TaxID=3012344 RepID=A0ABY7NSS9_9SPHN|nr:SPOR domain-containing protein [Sphingomonas abietis]WBO24197.1 septal ring lytic transglycosylase RlpA family protein [Sphingomonas abietis]